MTSKIVIWITFISECLGSVNVKDCCPLIHILSAIETSSECVCAAFSSVYVDDDLVGCHRE